MDSSRSLSACLRCRKQKLKCGGPGEVPCKRCRISRAECLFAPPKATRPVGSAATTNDRVALLEERLQLVERQLRSEIQELRAVVAPNTAPDPTAGPSEEEAEWIELHQFFLANCSSVVGFMDDAAFIGARQQLPSDSLTAIVICVVASRAIRPYRYQAFLDRADDAIKATFQGPTPDLMTLKALMLLVAWTGRTRLWGYVASIAIELRLNHAALQMQDENEPDEHLVDRARTWFTLCCFDLVMNVNRPFVINRMMDYLPLATKLLASPFRRSVDYRICVYIKGFTVAANAKGQFLQYKELRSSPLTSEQKTCLQDSNEQADQWFYDINNNINPEYQTFWDKQDRNRFMVPYAFILMYVNGFALHGLDPQNAPDYEMRLIFVQKALDGAVLLLRTQCGSQSFRKGLRYTMEYNCTTTYQAIKFILRAMTAAHARLDHGQVFATLQHAANMLEEAGAVEAAGDARRERERLAELAQTALSPEDAMLPPVAGHVAGLNSLYDIPSFLDGADDEFPEINMYLFN